MGRPLMNDDRETSNLYTVGVQLGDGGHEVLHGLRAHLIQLRRAARTDALRREHCIIIYIW